MYFPIGDSAEINVPDRSKCESVIMSYVYLIKNVRNKHIFFLLLKKKSTNTILSTWQKRDTCIEENRDLKMLFLSFLAVEKIYFTLSQLYKLYKKCIKRHPPGASNQLKQTTAVICI